MTFPTVSDTWVTTNQAIDFVTHPASSGDLIVIAYAWQAGNNPPVDWTVLDTANAGGNWFVSAIAKVADGTETTETITNHSVGAIVWIISGWYGSLAGVEVAASASADPPSLSPSWGSADTLWLAGHGRIASTVTINSGPAGYSGFLSTHTGGAIDKAGGGAWKQNTAASENPGTFSDSSVSTQILRVWTIAVRPGATTRSGQISFADVEIPSAPRDGEISFADLEIPSVNYFGEVSYADFEIPDSPASGQVAFANFTVPGIPASGQISFADLVFPDGSRQGEVSYADVEIPSAVQWTQFGVVLRDINSADYPGATFTLEVMLKTSDSGFPAHARVYNVTDDVTLDGVSEATTTSLTPDRVRSTAFTLSGDKVYRIDFGGAVGATYTCYDAVLIVQQ